MNSENNLPSLMKDIARYERTIGELLEENAALSADVQRRSQEMQAWFLNRQDALGADIDSLTNIVM